MASIAPSSVSVVATALLLATVTAASSCSHDSYLKVVLQSGDTPFTGVTEVDVKVSGAEGGRDAFLTYLSHDELSFDTMMAKTLSIAFTPSHSGVVALQVGVKTATGCVGAGATTATIKKGAVAAVTIRINHASVCPERPGDAGTTADVRDGSTTDGITFVGCDPAQPQAMCAASQTCFVNCTLPRGVCVPGGTKRPGEICVNNDDCMPGTQCFNYGDIPGCASTTKVCQKFCNNDDQCLAGAGTGGASGGGGASSATGGAAGAGGQAGSDNGGGGGAGGAASSGGATASGGAVAVPEGAISTCRNPVVCSGSVTTSYKTCSFACEPRGDGKLGCPAGLFCFLYRDSMTGQDRPDCGCRAPTRTGIDGESCLSSANCAPGHICNMMGGTQVCRKLCKMTSPTDCVAPQACGALQNNNAFGVCVGS